MKYIVFIVLCLYSVAFAYSEGKEITDPKQHTFFIKTEVDSVNNQFVFSWEADTNAIEIVIKRKLKSDSSFQFQPYSILQGNEVSFVDSNISGGESYEYGFEKWCGSYSAWNYLNVGYDLQLQEYRGKILVLVDFTVFTHLENEILRLLDDIQGDGWSASLKISPRAEEFDAQKVNEVKRIIEQEYIKSGGKLRAVLLFGRVPVPYSGYFSVDGHVPDHVGAWPSDVFYAELNGIWTDTLPTYDSASHARQHNFLGDGKYDQSYLPSDTEIEIGRVDFFDMPAFRKSEIELLRNYLNKNHKYRHGTTKFSQNAVIDDKFKMYSREAFAATAWMNFSALFPLENIDTASIRSHLIANKYLFSYGCNSGGTNSCYLVGYTDEFVNEPPLSAFYTALGSYFGDWDVQDNFLRAALASDSTVVASFWDGRPFWLIHHLGLGETIGFASKLTQNYNYDYESTSRYGNRFVHIALLGDPTLRIHIVEPPKFLKNPVVENEGISLMWEAPKDNIIGYNIYRRSATEERFVRINAQLIKNNEFIDHKPLLGRNDYQVRAVKKEHTPTGSYFNQSQSLYLYESYPHLNAKLNLIASPNPSFDKTQIVYKSAIDTKISIDIYNLEGRHIKQLYDGFSGTELSVIEFDNRNENGEKLAKGTYIISLKSENSERTFLLAVQ